MYTIRKLLLFTGIVFAISYWGCSDSSSPDDEEVGPPPPTQVLDWTYGGSLWLRLTNTVIPEFDATSGPVNVTVDQFGRMTFGTGSLPYEGDETQMPLRIKRSGNINIRPNGKWVGVGGEDHFAVNENSTVTETFQQWVWDGAQWLQVINETINSTFSGGLDFNLEDAVIGGGSVVSRTEQTGSVTWTLVLLPVDSVPFQSPGLFK